MKGLNSSLAQSAGKFGEHHDLTLQIGKNSGACGMWWKTTQY